jgi:hypothetical protein
LDNQSVDRETVESQPVKRRLRGWCEMAYSLGVSCNRDSRKGAAIQGELEPGSRGIAVVGAATGEV